MFFLKVVIFSVTVFNVYCQVPQNLDPERVQFLNYLFKNDGNVNGEFLQALFKEYQHLQPSTTTTTEIPTIPTTRAPLKRPRIRISSKRLPTTFDVHQNQGANLLDTFVNQEKPQISITSSGSSRVPPQFTLLENRNQAQNSNFGVSTNPGQQPHKGSSLFDPSSRTTVLGQPTIKNEPQKHETIINSEPNLSTRSQPGSLLSHNPEVAHRFSGVKSASNQKNGDAQLDLAIEQFKAQIASTSPSQAALNTKPFVSTSSKISGTQLDSATELFKSRIAAPSLSETILKQKLHVSTPRIEDPLEKLSSTEYDPEVFRKQAESAQYQFSSNIEDGINEQLHTREEERNGLAVKGKYSYSDGFFKRTVHYEADDKGYRVVNEEVEPIGEGPGYNPDASAKVSSLIAGNKLQYVITEDDLLKKKSRLEFDEVPLSA